MKEKLEKFLMSQWSCGNLQCENTEELTEGILNIFGIYGDDE